MGDPPSSKRRPCRSPTLTGLKALGLPSLNTRSSSSQSPPAIRRSEALTSSYSAVPGQCLRTYCLLQPLKSRLQPVPKTSWIIRTATLYMGLFPGCCTTALLLERRDISHVSPNSWAFSRRRMIFPLRVFPSFSGKAISAGTAIPPNTCRTWSFNWLLAFAGAIRFTSGTRIGGGFRLLTLR